jgi:hypothetical protein
MYLAREFTGSRPHFSIRESFPDGTFFRSRKLFDLGSDPSVFIVYPGGNAFYIDERVTDRLQALGVRAAEDVLEEVFWPFVKPRIRQNLAAFRNRAEAYRRRPTLSLQDQLRLQQQTHLFDKRRVHFLRVGRMDQGNIGRMPAKMLGWLAAKSRDELEQRFMQMEQVLKPHEHKTYVFVIFNLSRYFSQGFAKTHPAMLDTHALDEEFIKAVCRLNQDVDFWGGEDGHSADTLHAYLRRYAIMHFDGDYGPPRSLEDIYRDFVNRHRSFRFSRAVARVDYDEAGRIFGEPAETLRALDRRQLTRLYRSKARNIHPDVGGDHDGFIRLTEAYRDLMLKKGRG